jgi:hypothetical protein
MKKDTYRGLGLAFIRGLDRGDRNTIEVLTPLGNWYLPWLTRTSRDADDSCEKYGITWFWNSDWACNLFIDWGSFSRIYKL